MSGWTDPDRALGHAAGVHTPERRAEWHRARAATGTPEDRRAEAELSRGRLLVRVAAADRILAAAPAFVDPRLRHHHQAGDRATRDAVLARAAGHPDRATTLDALAADHADAAARLTVVSDERDAYLAYHAESLLIGESARDQLLHRGEAPGTETDRTTARTWLGLPADRTDTGTNTSADRTHLAGTDPLEAEAASQVADHTAADDLTHDRNDQAVAALVDVDTPRPTPTTGARPPAPPPDPHRPQRSTRTPNECRGCWPI